MVTFSELAAAGLSVAEREAYALVSQGKTSAELEAASSEFVGVVPSMEQKLINTNIPIPGVQRVDPTELTLPSIIPAIAGLLPAGLAGVAGIGTAIYSVLQALGLGEGGGIVGNNLLGGDTSTVNGVELGGPGLAEPGQGGQTLLKEWHVDYSWGTLQYYLVQTGVRSRKIAMYNTKTKRWKVWPWRTPHLAVIGKNMPRHQMIVRLRKNLMRHKADAKTILKLTDPKALRAPKRRR